MDDYTKEARHYLRLCAKKDRTQCARLIEGFQFPCEHEKILKRHIFSGDSISRLSTSFSQSPESIKAKLREMFFVVALSKKIVKNLKVYTFFAAY